MDADAIQPLAGIYGVCRLSLLFTHNRAIPKLPLCLYAMLCKLKVRLENKRVLIAQHTHRPTGWAFIFSFLFFMCLQVPVAITP